jgi:hypothetical protein
MRPGDVGFAGSGDDGRGKVTMARGRPVARYRELTRPECLERLAAGGLGRIAVTFGADHRPVVRPVDYAFDKASQAVVFRTVEGSKFHALVRARRACFEIDGIDPGRLEGWSVIVQGVCELISSLMEVERLEGLGLPSWASGPGCHWMRIRTETVTGRRITRVEASG